MKHTFIEEKFTNEDHSGSCVRYTVHNALIMIMVFSVYSQLLLGLIANKITKNFMLQ